jgi:hypothetical protein
MHRQRTKQHSREHHRSRRRKQRDEQQTRPNPHNHTPTPSRGAKGMSQPGSQTEKTKSANDQHRAGQRELRRVSRDQPHPKARKDTNCAARQPTPDDEPHPNVLSSVDISVMRCRPEVKKPAMTSHGLLDTGLRSTRQIRTRARQWRSRIRDHTFQADRVGSLNPPRMNGFRVSGQPHGGGDGPKRGPKLGSASSVRR